MSKGSGGAADSPLQQHFPLGLAEPTPNAVGLTDGQRMGAALGDDGAATAHLFRPHFALGAGAAALAVGVEEH